MGTKSRTEMLERKVLRSLKKQADEPAEMYYTLSLTQLEQALESGIRAALAGRQNKKNIAPELSKARPAFRRRIRGFVRAPK
jgi:hypothetical protein